MSNTQVRKITLPEELEQAFHIRRVVFMQEQQVSEADEFDGLDDESVQYLATIDGVAVATARWRRTKTGTKLERFAVLPAFRGKGIARKMVKQIMEDVLATVQASDRIYLHAQLAVTSLYEAEGFKSVGETFEECNIMHVEMEYRR